MRKIIFILLILFITTSAYGATRQEIQIALDLVRFTNVAQDLFNNAAKLARGEIKKTVGTFPNNTQEDMTVDDIKSALVRQMDNINAYKVMITQFLSDSEKRSKAVAGLQALRVDINSLIGDLQTMKNKLDTVKIETNNATTAAELKVIGDGIDNDIPQLDLVRNK